MSDDAAKPRILSRGEHSISRSNIHENALKVLYRLDRSGQAAYLVGGAVRDLLLGIEPKDYDVSTDARPPRVRRLFRNCRIIGRRFRLAHIYFREGIIEVSTFRRDPDRKAQAGGPDDLLITDDNVFGTPREDAFRRDFTINALFYNIADYSVIDYVGGIEDLKQRTLRVIGDADLRFQEDPIRMTRACELAGRLGLSIEDDTQRGIYDQRRELLKAAPARLTEELLGILRSGRAGASMQWMLELGLIEVVLPEVQAMLVAERQGLGHYGEVLPVLDGRVAAGEKPSDLGLLSALLLAPVVLRRHREETGRGKPLRGEALRQMILDEITPFFQRLTLARAKAERVAQTLATLDRVRRESFSDAERVRLAQRGYFPDLLLLMEIVARAEGDERGELELWRRVAANRRPEGRRRGDRRPRRRRRRARGARN